MGRRTRKLTRQGRGRHFGAPATAVIFVFLASLASSPASGPTSDGLPLYKPLSQYRSDIWRSDDGLPQDSVRAIVQTSDGYLWLGTQGGLARFDGLAFTTFHSANTLQLRNSSINALCQSTDGSLWIGTAGGLSRYRNGDFQTYTTQDGLPGNIVEDLACTPQGEVWIGVNGAGLVRFHDNNFQAWGGRQGLTDETVLQVVPGEGEIWIGTRTGGLHTFRRKQFRRLEQDQGLSPPAIRALAMTSRGTLWVGTQDGAYRMRDDRFEKVDLGGKGNLEIINVIREDRHGSVWLGTKDGLLRFVEGRVERFGVEQGLCSPSVLSLLEDREGNLWIGTRDGLQRLRNGAVSTFTTQQGLSHDHTWAVTEDSVGDVWIATAGGGLNRFSHGEFRSFGRREGLSGDVVRTLMVDRKGRLWAGSAGTGVFRLEKDRFRAVAKDELGETRIRTMTEDRFGNVWIGTSGDGLKKLTPEGRLTSYTIRQGFISDQIWSLFEDSRGDLWVGTGDSGLCLFSEGRCSLHFDESSGLGNGQVLTIQEDLDDVLWVSTDGGGLTRIRNGLIDGKIDSLGDELLGVVCFLLQVDDDFWISSNRGVFRISRLDLVRFMTGEIPRISYEVFGKSEGMLGYQHSGTNPAGVRTRDGRLWFATPRGVSVINPERRRDRPTPLVVIEELLVDSRVLKVASDPSLALEAGADDFEIRYAALSFIDPKRIRFRYRLSPLESEWTEAGNRRTAYYSRIPPGHYDFEVKAIYGGEPWNVPVTRLALQQRPFFHQTPVFYVLCAAGFLVMIWLSLRWRVSGLHRRNRQLSLEIFERRKAEEALRRSEQRFRSYFEMPLVGFAVSSPRGRLLEVNDRLCDMLGYKREELLGKWWLELNHSDGLEEDDDEEWGRLRRGDVDHLTIDRRYRRRDGKMIHAKHSAACVRDPQGRIDHFVEVIQDTTAAKRLEEHLRDSSKMEAIGRLAGGVAHDFNNIITVISGYGQLLRQSVVGDTTLMPQVEAILSASEKAEGLTRQLLAFSRRQLLDLRILDLNQVVSEMKDLLKPLIGEDIRLITRLARNLHPIRVDAGQIQQVLMNLAVNSRDAMPDGGTLEFVTKSVTLAEGEIESVVKVPAGDYVMISVRDTGFGMDEETARRAFEPFYTTKVDGEGTGLGLATVYGIVKQSEGFIFFETGPDQGTIFRIYFPVVESARPPALPEVLEHEAPPEGQETVLVVEDDDGIRSLISAVLERSGYHPLGAENGTVALDLVERHQGEIDLLLTDVVMPGMNGKELARRLTSSMPGLPVIFMSGYTEEAIDRHGVLEPGTDFVQKPFTPRDLAGLIRKALDRTA